MTPKCQDCICRLDGVCRNELSPYFNQPRTDEDEACNKKFYLSNSTVFKENENDESYLANFCAFYWRHSVTE